MWALSGRSVNCAVYVLYVCVLWRRAESWLAARKAPVWWRLCLYCVCVGYCACVRACVRACLRVGAGLTWPHGSPGASLVVRTPVRLASDGRARILGRLRLEKCQGHPCAYLLPTPLPPHCHSLACPLPNGSCVLPPSRTHHRAQEGAVRVSGGGGCWFRRGSKVAGSGLRVEGVG